MSDSIVFKTERPWPNKRLKIGAIVGHTTSTTAKLWLRTGKTGSYTLLWYSKENDENNEVFKGFKKVPYPLTEVPNGVLGRKFEINNWDDDSTVVLNLEDLNPDTDYGYGLYSEGENRVVLGQDRLHNFRTMPEQDVSLSFGFFSCHMPYSETIFGNTVLDNMDMWDLCKTSLERHRDKDLRFIIAGGDQVYVDGVKTLSLWRLLDKVMRVEDGDLLPTQEDMVSWYRDIYRGYWGFSTLQKVYSSFPTYMIWDDHELGDGWGSYFLKDGDTKAMAPMLPSLDSKNLTFEQGKELFDRMFRAGKQVYNEYQHSHNPDTDPGIYDYGYYVADCAYYVLDGRGNRDVTKDSLRILGREQLNRFEEWLEKEETRSKSFLFVVSAVPVLHLRPSLVNADRTALAKKLELSDDMRDSWEHALHDDEREELTRLLFKVAARKQRVCILSGDVHIAAAFSLRDQEGNVIYQLTSSAITYNVPRPVQTILQFGVPDSGKTKEGYAFERLALFTQSNFSIIKVNQEKKEVVFQLYGPQVFRNVEEIDWENDPISHSMAKIPLTFI